MKISHTLLKRMIESNCSKTDFNLIFYIARFQFDNGLIPNLYYKDVIDALGIHTSTYYRCLYRLQECGVLTYDITDNVYGYHTIQLLDNDYSNPAYCKFNLYVNANHEFFSTSQFLDLKASEKYLVLKLIMRKGKASEKDREIKLSDEWVAKYAQITTSNKKLTQKLVSKMSKLHTEGKQLFKVFIDRRKKKNVNFFTFNHFNKVETISEQADRQRFNFINYFKKHRIKYTKESLDSLCQDDHIYRHYNIAYKCLVKEIVDNHGEVKMAIIRAEMKKIMKKKEYAGDLGTSFPFYVPLI